MLSVWSYCTHTHTHTCEATNKVLACAASFRYLGKVARSVGVLPGHSPAGHYTDLQHHVLDVAVPDGTTKSSGKSITPSTAKYPKDGTQHAHTHVQITVLRIPQRMSSRAIFSENRSSVSRSRRHSQVRRVSKAPLLPCTGSSFCAGNAGMVHAFR